MGLPVNELRLGQSYFDGESCVELVGFGRRDFLASEINEWVDEVEGDDMCVALQKYPRDEKNPLIFGRSAHVFAGLASPMGPAL